MDYRPWEGSCPMTGHSAHTPSECPVPRNLPPVQRISGFQPVGDAAEELRKIIPALGYDQGHAVAILRSAEYNGASSQLGYTVTYDGGRYQWIVTEETHA